MPTTIKPGSQVIVVEGVRAGEKGKVTSIFRRYDEISAQTHKLVTFETDKGKKITTRLSWTREL